MAGILAWFIRGKVETIETKQKEQDAKAANHETKIAVMEATGKQTERTLTSIDGKIDTLLETQNKHGTKLARIQEKVFGSHDSGDERSGIR
jgi:hypothetical protein